MKRAMVHHGLALGALLWAFGLGLGGCGQDHETHEVQHSHQTMSLRIEDFQRASTELTNKMLASPRFQAELKQICAQTHVERPLIKISRIKDNTGLIPPIPMADYLVAPMEEVFTNSNQLDFYSEDKTGRDIGAAQEQLGEGRTRLPDLILYGTVGRLSTYDSGVNDNAYTFSVRVTNTRTQSQVFIGNSEPITKEKKRSGVSW